MAQSREVKKAKTGCQPLDCRLLTVGVDMVGGALDSLWLQKLRNCPSSSRSEAVWPVGLQPLW